MPAVVAISDTERGFRRGGWRVVVGELEDILEGFEGEVGDGAEGEEGDSEVLLSGSRVASGGGVVLITTWSAQSGYDRMQPAD